jgi:hypothetical protein
MNINPNDRNREIETILDKGLISPVSTWRFIRNMCRQLGFRMLFWDTVPAILVSGALALGYVGLGLMQVERLGMIWNVHALLFLFSPALFISLTVLTEIIERFSGLYEIKNTCKYTIRQITSARLLGFSLVGLVFTVLSNAWLSSAIEVLQFMQLFSLALCAIFLCSLLMIYSMRRFGNGWYIGALIWIGIGVMPMILLGRDWERVLTNLPPALTFGIAVIALVFFLREIKINTKGVLNYAYR